MPRKPTFQHPLRTIREAAGLTQPKLAALIGVSKAAVEKLENGRMAMSHDTAVKIRHQLGCHIVRKTDRETGKKSWSVSSTVLREGGRRTSYKTEDYESRRDMLQSVGQDNGADWQEGLASAVTLLLKAATRAGHLPSVAFDLEQTIGKLVDSHRLQPHLAGVLRDEHQMDPDTAKSTARAFTVIPAMTGRDVLRHRGS